MSVALCWTVFVHLTSTSYHFIDSAAMRSYNPRSPAPQASPNPSPGPSRIKRRAWRWLHQFELRLRSESLLIHSTLTPNPHIHTIHLRKWSYHNFQRRDVMFAAYKTFPELLTVCSSVLLQATNGRTQSSCHMYDQIFTKTGATKPITSNTHYFWMSSFGIPEKTPSRYVGPWFLPQLTRAWSRRRLPCPETVHRYNCLGHIAAKRLQQCWGCQDAWKHTKC